MASQIRQNYHEDCEAALNKHINVQLHLSYVYLSMGYHFDRDDVALPGFAKFFLKASEVSKSHADEMMKYQNQRGGRLVLQGIPAPSVQEWGAAAENIKSALDIKKQVNQSLLDLSNEASSKDDHHMCHFIDDNFLEEHVEMIRKLGNIITQLKRVGTGTGLYMYDREFM